MILPMAIREAMDKRKNKKRSNLTRVKQIGRISLMYVLTCYPCMCVILPFGSHARFLFHYASAHLSKSDRYLSARMLLEVPLFHLSTHSFLTYLLFPDFCPVAYFRAPSSGDRQFRRKPRLLNAGSGAVFMSSRFADLKRGVGAGAVLRRFSFLHAVTKKLPEASAPRLSGKSTPFSNYERQTKSRCRGYKFGSGETGPGIHIANGYSCASSFAWPRKAT